MSPTHNSWLRANSPTELMKLLSVMEITVPPRGAGRKPEHCERYLVARFLATYAKTKLFSYPLELIKQEAPDFLLRMSTGTIGIEITEAIPPDQAEIDAYQELLGTEAIYQYRFQPNSFKNKDELSKIVRDGTKNEGWTDEELATYWANWILHSYNRKAKMDYGNSTPLWLLIYDNISSLNIDIAPALNAVRQGLALSNHKIDRMFIESKNSFYELQSQGWSSHLIPDW